ncbi:hypothetical protein ATZ36_17635 [Candidatus Endomicrobiellum trichonymphae]|uniref:Uncharacterized protein n=1 Tax=Endomicrobium trichonymphae TaxID=1408204 RepID=A0A1E5IK34_ENDTX|nr:hypothetical protein ATZ36_17635 [Candidatus Endomicrobium trichonymphae]
MTLYSNLCSVEINGAFVKSKSVLRLTSEVFLGAVSSNSLSEKQKEFINGIFKEAEENNFIVQIYG